jgi:hypothetical protein
MRSGSFCFWSRWVDAAEDAVRQPIDSLRGYAYQVVAAALTRLDLEATLRAFSTWPRLSGSV